MREVGHSIQQKGNPAVTCTRLLAASFCTLLLMGSQQFQSRIRAEQPTPESNLLQIEQQAEQLVAASRLRRGF